MSFAEIYLREREITEQTVRSYGLELDAFLANKKARTRLGRSLAGYGVAEILTWMLSLILMSDRLLFGSS
jgi:hypothetical protein